MRSGDVIRDGQGSTYQVGQTMGRGLWGSSFLIRRESSDSLHVLKVPLGPEDFRTDAAITGQLTIATREAAAEQFRLYEQGGHSFLPKLEGKLALPDGRTGYILPRMHDSMERRLNEGIPVSVLLNILSQIVRHVRTLSGATGAGGGIHGNLRGSNIFFNERGELLLTDIATPTLRRAFARLVSVHPHSSNRFPPPELMERPDDAPWTQGVDTYGIAVLMLQGLMTGEPLPPIWREGLTKQTCIHLKHRIVERLKQEESNPRFHQRMADRTVAFLSRALSREMAPCPPYRFSRLEEFQTRLDELCSLIHPRIHTMGRVLLERPPTQSFFLTDEQIRFSCTVGVSTGVEGQDEIGVGMAVFDLDRSERLKLQDLSYNIDKHPPGRFRFQFGIGGLGPGRYRTRLAFTIRDTSDAPTTNEIEFLVRPAAGWTPPVEAPPQNALPFERPDPRAQPEPSRPDPRLRELRTAPELRAPEPRDLRPPDRGPEPRVELPRVEIPRAETRPEPPRAEVCAEIPRLDAREQREPQRELQREPQRELQREPQRELQREPQREPQRESQREPQRELQRDPRGDAARTDLPRLDMPQRPEQGAIPRNEALSPATPLPLPRNEPRNDPRNDPRNEPSRPTPSMEPLRVEPRPESRPEIRVEPVPRADLSPVHALFDQPADSGAAAIRISPVTPRLAEPSQPPIIRLPISAQAPRPAVDPNAGRALPRAPMPPPRPPPRPNAGRTPLGEDTPPVAHSRNWTMEPLPGARIDPAMVEEEDPTTSLTDESAEYTEATVAEEAGLIDRIVQVFRNDPVTLMMSLLAVAIVIILIILLIQSS